MIQNLQIDKELTNVEDKKAEKFCGKMGQRYDTNDSQKRSENNT